MCDVFKTTHPNDYDEIFFQNIIKKRKDLDHIED